MTNFQSDAKYALRSLLKAKGLTIVAVLTLALAIGANTAIFSVVNAAMLRPLPYPNADRLVSIYHAYTKFNMNFVTVSPDTFKYYREHATSFDQMAAYTGFHAPANLTGAGEPQRISAWKANAGFFRALGTKPALGRTFTDQEDQPGSDRVAVLSYPTWQNTFGGAQMLGREITLDGANYTVIGVMPKGFEFPEEAELWIPMAFTPEQFSGGSEYLNVIATLKPGITAAQAQAEMSKLTHEILARDKDPSNRNGWSANAMPLQAASVADVKTALWIILAAVGCVLLIACANIANLLLARATARQKEIAIRMALGATRWRVIRQLLTEGVLLGIGGGITGLLLAYSGLDFLLKVVPVRIPTYIHVGIDPNVLAFTFGISVLTGVLFSTLPAIQAAKIDNSETLKEGGRTAASTGKHIVRGAIAVAQLALAMILLVSAGLLIKTFMRIQQADMGFNSDNVLTFRTNLPEDRYKESAKTLNFYDQVLQRIRSLPGVKSAAITSQVPLTRNMSSTFSIAGKTFDTEPHAHVGLIGPDYFATMQTPLLSGRTFTD
ncbi:MAG TPA: ABC transporter permease, partial [Terriglobales bacterium]